MRCDWVLQTCHSGALSCENDNAESKDIPEVLKILEKKYKIEYDSKCAAALDGDSTHISGFIVEGKHVYIGWDCWSGVYIMASSADDNQLIEEVYKYLSEGVE